ncbi:hypothetical protein [Paenisporosarcina cavernae]|nr:hypothetical protein [Paenisporosarcina cavernae]
MVLGIFTVVGFMVLLGFVGHSFLHFVSKSLISHDSVHIDEKPDTLY